MALFRRAKRTSHVTGPVFDGEIPHRFRATTRRGTYNVNANSALRHSAVWACLRLRSDLISSFPCDVFTDSGGSTPIEVKKPDVLLYPGGPRWSYRKFMWATEFDLDRSGNTVGFVRQRDERGKPALIELVDICSVTVRHQKDGRIKYVIYGDEYDQDVIWHETQFQPAGSPVGLDPIAMAAYSIGEYMSMQEFALDWFGGGGVPKARLKNTARKINAVEARLMKDRYNATVRNGDLFVTGSDWDYDMMQAQTAGLEFIEGRKWGVTEIARYFGAPLDLIEAAPVGDSGNINYANVTQRHLQFLILQLGPAAGRREETLTELLAKPRYVKLNPDSLLRMDPIQRAEYLNSMVEGRLMTNTEAREKDNRRPLTSADIKEFEEIYGPPKAAAPAPASGAPSNDQPAKV
jgi:HK97 family phage portal protein